MFLLQMNLSGIQHVGQHITPRTTSIISAYGRKWIFDSEDYLEREEYGPRMDQESLNHTVMSCIH